MPEIHVDQDGSNEVFLDVASDNSAINWKVSFAKLRLSVRPKAKKFAF